MRIGLLGAAKITPEAIIEPARHMDNVVLAIAARDKTRAQAFARTHQIDLVFDSYQALLSSPDIDLIYNALPINLHAEWSIKALSAGKHVLCEKPLAMNSRQVRAMIIAAKNNNVRLIEAFHYAHHPLFDQFKQLIRAEEIGVLNEIDARFCVAVADLKGDIRYRPELGGGAMMDLGCYPLHWFRAISEAPITALHSEARMTSTGVDECMTVNIQLENGVTATLYCSMAATEEFDARIIVRGSAGKLVFYNPLTPHTNGRIVVNKEQGTEQFTANSRSTYAYQLAAVKQALSTGSSLVMEGQELLAQQELLDRIYIEAGLGELRLG